MNNDSTDKQHSPLAWLHSTHGNAYVITHRIKALWLECNDKRVENYTIPLYAAPQAGTTAEPHGRATASQDPVRDTEPADAAPSGDVGSALYQAMLTLQHRCGYIINFCKDTREMRLEAEEMLRVLRSLPAPSATAFPMAQAEALQFEAKGLLAMMAAALIHEAGCSKEDNPEEWALLGLCLPQMECYAATVKEPDTVTIWQRVTNFLNRPRPSLLPEDREPT